MQICMVCKTREVHVNYEFDGGHGFCGPMCERTWLNAQYNAELARVHEFREYDDMFADAMELDPSERI